MSKLDNRERRILLISAILLLSIISIVRIKTIVVKGQGGPVLPVLPVETISTYQMNNDATSTPNATQVAEYSKTVYPTPTEIPISKYFDLSPNLDDQDKFVILVKHSDGTYEQFTVGPLRPDTPLLLTELPDYILTEIPLQPRDEIISWLLPADPYRAIPTESYTASQAIMISPTDIPPKPVPFSYP